MNQIRIKGTPFSISKSAIVESLEDMLEDTTHCPYNMVYLVDGKLNCYYEDDDYHIQSLVLDKVIEDEKIISLYKAISNLKEI